MKKKFYITTPIYYINAKPHIGHAYSTIMADVLARYHRLDGEDVFYLTGTDENSQKNIQAAEMQGETNIGAYLDRMSATWQLTWKTLSITNDDFIRTTESRHHRAVIEFFKRVEVKGDIYKGIYKGLYCVGCESFKLPRELDNGLCPDHRRPPQPLEEENYFFRASKYKKRILKYIENHPKFIQPAERRNEVAAYIQDHFADVSISRAWKSAQHSQGVTLGIPVPGDESQAIYVWFDALINYLTGAGFGYDEKRFAQYWPADLHVVGKEIIKFHCALWPAMLMGAGLELPKCVFAHGWLTVEGEKMSKTLGNIVDPLQVEGEYSNDVLRYFLLREFPWGGDGNFSIQRIKERYQADLANGLGNLSRRILTLGERMLKNRKSIDIHGLHCGSSCDAFKEFTGDSWQKYQQAMQEFYPDIATMVTWRYIEAMDRLLETSKPWELTESNPFDQWNNAIYPLLEGLRHLAWMLLPLMPETAEQLFRCLGIWTKERQRDLSEAVQWGLLSTKAMDIRRGEVLFPRL